MARLVTPIAHLGLQEPHRHDLAYHSRAAADSNCASCAKRHGIFKVASDHNFPNMLRLAHLPQSPDDAFESVADAGQGRQATSGKTGSSIAEVHREDFLRHEVDCQEIVPHIRTLLCHLNNSETHVIVFCFLQQGRAIPYLERKCYCRTLL